MPPTTAVTKAELLKLIDRLETTPNDKVRILGDAGITIVGAGLGAAAAGTLATAAGVTSIFGVTSIAGWLGLTVVAATPVGWVLGGAAAAGAAAYTVSRLIRSGGLSEGRKAELLNRYREEARSVAAKEAAGSINDSDRTRFIVALRELIDKDMIPPDVAFRFIEQVERGGVPISQAFSMIHSLLAEVDVERGPVEARGADVPFDVTSKNPSESQNTESHKVPVGSDVRGDSNALSKFGSSVAASLSQIGRSVSETGAGWIAKAEPGISSVSSTATDAVSSAGEVAGKVRDQFAGWFQKVPREATEPTQPPAKGNLDVEQLARDAAPVIWLLGKTGAGKSSVISKLTGATHVEVGNGFVSCTRTSQLFDFPHGAPLLRFLDTRGLGEPGYDPTDDIAWSQSQAHLILVVMKVDDPSQEEVLLAVESVRRCRPEWPVMVVQTGLHELYPRESNDHPLVYPFGSDDEAQRRAGGPRELLNALHYQRGLFAKIKGKRPIFVPVDFTQIEDGFVPHDYGKSALIDCMLDVAPEGVKVLVRMKLQQEEAGLSDRRMQALNLRILYWAAGAAAVGAAPVVGLVTVPATQTAMLAQLATVYGVDWGAKDVGALAGMLGTAIVANQGALMLFRQIAKIGPWVIPIAAAQDYAVTYGLGRAACVYLQARQDNTDADAEQVKAAFFVGLKQAFAARDKEVAA